MATHACLKNFTEDEKYNNLMTWLKCPFANYLDMISNTMYLLQPVQLSNK